MPFERRLCYALIAFLIAQSLTMVIIHLSLCTPFEALWAPNIPGARCVNRTAVYFVQLGFTIAMDFVVLIAPLFILRHMRRPWPQKLLISIALAFGGTYVSKIPSSLSSLFAQLLEKVEAASLHVAPCHGRACIVSVLRLRTIYLSTHSTDSTWDKVPSALYGVIEPNLGITCACLVTLRPLLPALRSSHSQEEMLRTPTSILQGSEPKSHISISETI